ncbi:MAG: autotransporter outer membrane beta-barrel domain-containing protein [Acidaminococcaceae bacterium]|nr:autotransporter outer membrane beta-barrel domain-containing protein [Acidaminococcaceae bacterium]MBQ5344259.1 autotransporter outer membrane beta-barrel domain-containing protein [Acidaminococcaceae bacterium]
MLKKKTKIQKRLAKIVLTALLCTGGVHGLYSPSPVEASELTVTGCTWTTTGPIFTPEGSMIQVKNEYAFIPADTNTTVLNLNGDWNFSVYIYGHHEAGSSDVSGYTVNLNGPKISYGLEGADAKGGGNATDNHVKVSTGTVNGLVAGGYSSKGSAIGNSVEIEGGTFSPSYGTAVAGGASAASASGNANQNTVIIKGGNFERDVAGGLVKDPIGLGNANENRVTISGGEIGTSESGNIRGGYAVYSGTANNNTVEISGGKINKNVYGGESNYGEASGNTVTISGNPTFAADSSIYGAYSRAGNAQNNTVNILASGLTIKSLFGGLVYDVAEGGTSSGNTLNIAATGVTAGSVDAFQTIALSTGDIDIGNGEKAASLLKFTDGATVLSSSSFKNADGSNFTGTLDITKNDFTGTGKMTLLASGTNDNFTTLKLAYDDATKTNPKTLDATTPSVVVKSGGDETLSNKVVLTTTGGITHTVSLDTTNNYRNVLYTIAGDGNVTVTKVDLKNWDGATYNLTDAYKGTSVPVATGSFTEPASTRNILNAPTANFFGEVTGDRAYTSGASTPVTSKGVTISGNKTGGVRVEDSGKTLKYYAESIEVQTVNLGAMTWNDGLVAAAGYDFAGVTDASVDATNLKFANPEAVAPGATMKMLSGATGLVAGTDITGHTQTFSHELANDVSLNATLSGTVVRSTAGEIDYKALATTVNSVNLANWKGNASAVVPSGWTGKGVTVSGSFTGPELAANSSQDILTDGASGMFTDDAIADAIKYKAGVTFEGDEANGVTLAGTQSKGVKADDGGKKLVYAVGTKDVTGITLGNIKVGTPRDMNKDYNFAGITTLDASGLAFDKPENVNADVNLVTNAAGIPSGMDATAGKDHSQSFEQTAKNNVKLTANLKGAVKTDTNVVKYAYGGKELTKVDLKDWNGSDATFDATGWTKGASAVVETAGLSVTVDPGVEKTVLTVSGVDLTGITVNGEAYQWKEGGDSIAETSAENGVKITAGETTGGGIKGDGNKIIYKGSSKTVTGLEITSVDFVKDGVARAFKNDYDLTNADITVASGISVSNTEAMNPGDTMVVVDATNAIKVAGKEKQTLKDFTTINAGKAIDFADAIDGKALTLSGTHQDTLEQNGDKNQILYKVGDKNVNKATFTGEVAWNDSEAYYTNDTSKYIIAATNVDATNLKVTGTTTKALKKGDAMTLLSAEGMTATLAKDQSDANKKESKVVVNYSDATSGIVFGAEATGGVKTATGAVNYEVTGVTLKSVDLGGWSGTTGVLTAGDTSSWMAADKSVAVKNADAISVTPTATQAILTAGSSMFADVNVVKETAFDPVTQNGVTLTGTQTNTIKTAKTAVDNDTILYEIGKKDVKKVNIGEVAWGGAALDGGKDYNYTNASVNTEGFGVTYAKPEEVAAKQSMTLLKANDSLKAIVNEEKAKTYSIEPVAGVTIDAKLTGKLANSGNNVVFTATENKASALTFGKVEWTGDTPLLDHSKTLANVSFDGATVDTSNIDFYKEMYIEADQTTTLVSDFGGTPKEIKGSKYMVGTAFDGEGSATMENGNLIFRTKTSAGVSEQTHKAVMGVEATMGLLATGKEHEGNVLDGLGNLSNVDSDGASVAASFGGGKDRYETGSHVNINSWSAAVGVGARKETKKGTLQYGIFGEYGKGNYTMHSDVGRSDGEAHYAGGGLMAKWTNKHDVYTEASFRLGRVSDSANDLLRDGAGNAYGYDIHATYYGAHVGLGKIFNYKGGKSLDVYGKFFYTKRDGAEFDAKQHYNLDSVNSSVLRIGARYGTTDKKWNWYGGLAYEYEFDGESKGTVNGTEIRAASIKGSSVRGEIGMKMNATRTNPWQMDISLYGYGGKHRGFGGNVNVAYMF